MLVEILKVVIGALLCAWFLWGTIELHVWWKNRKLRKLLNHMDVMLEEMGTGRCRTAWQNILDDYEEYILNDDKLKMEVRISRIELIRAIAERAEGVQ